jgi:hypothetical protein
VYRYLMVAAVAAILPSLAPAAMPQRVVFEETDTFEQKWTLKDLDPALPHDWTDYNFLVLEMKASSPQRFELILYSGDRAQRRQMQPFANLWIRASVPLQYYRQPKRTGTDLASIGKVPQNTFWISTGGTMGPLNAVDAIGVAMRTPLGKPTLEIRSVRLAKDDPGSDVLDRKPIVDQFGQWIAADWPGKIIGLAQLQKEWASEDAALGAGDFGFCKYGGYLNTRTKATGYFRVEQIDGQWWFVDPDGHLFYSTSSTGMGAGGGESRLRGRED